MTDDIDILVVGSNRNTGGIQRYIDQQSEHLSDNASVRIYDTEVPSGSGLLWLLSAVLTTFWHAFRFPIRLKPDVVHVHAAHWFSFYRASFYVIFAAKVWQVPVILHIHGSSFDDFLRSESIFAGLVQRVTFGTCSEVVALSEYWRREIAKNSTAERITVVPNAVDPSRYDPSPGSEPPSVVFISHLIERKGVDQFLEALTAVHTEVEDFDVHIAGDGPLRERVEAFAGEYDNVSYHGYVSEEKKRELLTSSSIYVLPTLAEGLPIAILEAMAAANAIVSTRVGGIPDLVEETNGRLVSPSDIDSLCDELICLLLSSEEARTMGEQNRILIESSYNWDEVTETLLNIYEFHLNRE